MLDTGSSIAPEGRASTVASRQIVTDLDDVELHSLEMIGYFSELPGSQRYPSAVLALLYPTRGDFIALVGRPQDVPLVRSVKRAVLRASPLPVRSMTAPVVVAGSDFSDHRNYWKQGYPALMVTETAFLRNPAYHTDRDRADTLDYARMASVVRGVYAAIVALARG